MLTTSMEGLARFPAAELAHVGGAQGVAKVRCGAGHGAIGPELSVLLRRAHEFALRGPYLVGQGRSDQAGVELELVEEEVVRGRHAEAVGRQRLRGKSLMLNVTSTPAWPATAAASTCRSFGWQVIWEVNPSGW